MVSYCSMTNFLKAKLGSFAARTVYKLTKLLYFLIESHKIIGRNKLFMHFVWHGDGFLRVSGHRETQARSLPKE